MAMAAVIFAEAGLSRGLLPTAYTQARYFQKEKNGPYQESNKKTKSS